MDKVQKYNSFNTNTPSSESYKNRLLMIVNFFCQGESVGKRELLNRTMSQPGKSLPYETTSQTGSCNRVNVQWCACMRVCPKVSGPAACSENCK
jgi:hypothetical protein